MIGVHPSIHDLGIKRNESQKKDLLKSQIIMGGFLILCAVCLIISFGLGVLFSLTGVFWALIANEYYEKSITPTPEQENEFNERRGVYCQRIHPAEDKKE